MNRTRAATVLGWLLVALTTATAGGCVEWLEVDVPIHGSDVQEEPASVRHAAYVATLPNVPPRASAKGPIVPQTPGLRVPDGYWTRVRIDQADLLLPYTWAVLQPSGYSGEGEPSGMVLRLQAMGERQSTVPGPLLRGVLRVATPSGTSVSQLVGLSLGADALVDSTVSLRISKGALWHVVPERFSIDALDEHVMTGTLEGSARAGKQAKRVRRFRASFVALRAGMPEQGSAPVNKALP